MSEAELIRVRGDLAVIQRAMGLQLSFGRWMLGFGTVFGIAATCAAVISLLGEGEWLQIGPLATIMVVGPIWLYLRSRCTADVSPESEMQVALSVTIYSVVWIAAFGYMSAPVIGPVVGAARTAALHAVTIGMLFGFSLILVRAAVKSPDRHYCLGLALPLLLSALLMPIIDRRYIYPLAHGLMAIGYLSGVAIQRAQLHKTAGHHAAD